MDDFTKRDLEQALQAISSMIGKADKAKAKFAEGTSQYTLQKNRLDALNIASLLISKELEGNNAIDYYTKGDFEKAIEPISSLISKSEKAQRKLSEGSWQHTMLGNNLKALHIASLLLTKVLSELNAL